MNPYHREAESVQYRWYSNMGDNRGPLVAKYSWAIPDENAIQLLAGMGPIIEMGAGNGYWASLIAAAGGAIEAYDARPGCHAWGSRAENLWHPVKEGDPAVLTRQHREHTLLLVWPTYDSPFAYEALGAYVRAGGKRLVFVGEGRGGCAANDSFFKLLDAHFMEVGDAAIPQWEGIHDYLTVYQRE